MDIYSSFVSQFPIQTSDAVKKNKEPRKKIDYRLPETLEPYFYTLYLKPDIYTGSPETFTFTGKVVMNFTCLKSTKEIVVNQVSY